MTFRKPSEMRQSRWVWRCERSEMQTFGNAFVDGVKIEDISLDEVARLISGRIGTNVNIQVKGKYGPIQLERIAP